MDDVAVILGAIYDYQPIIKRAEENIFKSISKARKQVTELEEEIRSKERSLRDTCYELEVEKAKIHRQIDECIANESPIPQGSSERLQKYNQEYHATMQKLNNIEDIRFKFIRAVEEPIYKLKRLEAQISDLSHDGTKFLNEYITCGEDVSGGQDTVRIDNQVDYNEEKPNQVHHYATSKSKTYTFKFEKIAIKYGLDLEGEWNKGLLPHQGRHPNVYHDYVLASMKRFHIIARGNKNIFLKLYNDMTQEINSNPNILYKNYWKELENEIL